jgi:hypothetical protein
MTIPSFDIPREEIDGLTASQRLDVINEIRIRSNTPEGVTTEELQLAMRFMNSEREARTQTKKKKDVETTPFTLDQFVLPPTTPSQADA